MRKLKLIKSIYQLKQRNSNNKMYLLLFNKKQLIEKIIIQNTKTSENRLFGFVFILNSQVT